MGEKVSNGANAELIMWGDHFDVLGKRLFESGQHLEGYYWQKQALACFTKAAELRLGVKLDENLNPQQPIEEGEENG